MRAPRSIRLLLALLGPAVLLAVALPWLLRPPPVELSDAARVLDDRLARWPYTDVILLGNSMVAANVDAAALGERLGLEGKPVIIGHVASAMPTWYAILENRVYAHDIHPKLIVIPCEVPFVMFPGITLAEADRLAQQRGAEETALDAVLYAQDGSPLLRRAQLKRAPFRNAVLDGIRDLALGLLMGSKGEGSLAEQGSRVAADSLTQVFADEAMLDGPRGGALPVVDVREERDNALRPPPTSVEGTTVPLFIDLAAAHGTRVVFVEQPMPSSSPRRTVDPAVRHALVAYLNTRPNAAYVDLHEARFEDSEFRDRFHMGPRGRTRMTGMIADALVEIDALGTAPFAPTRLDELPKVQRTGAGPAMPELEFAPVEGKCLWRAAVPGLIAMLGERALSARGLAAANPFELWREDTPLPWSGDLLRDTTGECSGGWLLGGRTVYVSPPAPDDLASARYSLHISPDLPVQGESGTVAWWVPPGTSLSFSLSQPPEGEGPVRVLASGVGVGRGSALSAQLELNGANASFEEDEEEVFFEATASASPGPGGWKVSITVDEDSDWLLLTEVEVQRGDDSRTFIRKEVTVRSSMPVRAYAGLHYPRPVPDIGPWKLEGGRSEGKGTVVRIPELEPLSDTTLMRTYRAHQCSPIQILEDGVALPLAHTVLKDVEELGGGRTLHTGPALWFSAPDNSDAATNGRTYQARLDPDRPCRSKTWVYPGDLAILTVEKKGLLSLPAAANGIEIVLHPIGEAPKGRARIKASTDVETLAESEFSFDELDGSPVWLPFSHALVDRIERFELSVETDPTDAFLLVSGAWLSRVEEE